MNTYDKKPRWHLDASLKRLVTPPSNFQKSEMSPAIAWPSQRQSSLIGQQKLHFGMYDFLKLTGT
jgi:hypothetical protein